MALAGITHCRKVENYRQAVLHVGGDVRVLEPGMDVAVALEGLDGLLLTGGEDVHPSRYGETPHPTVTDPIAERDAFEIDLIQEARRIGLPTLAICRGIQVLNVAAGGSLIQDIPSQVPSAIQHDFPGPQHEPFHLAHDVWLERDSLLARLMRESISNDDTLAVNSRHHQAVKQVAPGFRVVATAPDGVIEAIEDPNARFCLAVQWHPENFWRTGEFRALFEGFLNAGR
ncbi:MAG: gamma-glutamyl-gamma-aminobutyrate hydrolase family protein [Vicinamibacterales bacterium]